MKKWQKRKLRDELISLTVALIGVILVVLHMFDTCPWVAWIGILIAVFGIFAFADIRNKKYNPKNRRRNQKAR